MLAGAEAPYRRKRGRKIYKAGGEHDKEIYFLRVDFLFSSKILKKCFSPPSTCRITSFILLPSHSSANAQKYIIEGHGSVFAVNFPTAKNFSFLVNDTTTIITHYFFCIRQQGKSSQSLALGAKFTLFLEKMLKTNSIEIDPLTQCGTPNASDFGIQFFRFSFCFFVIFFDRWIVHPTILPKTISRKDKGLF